MRARVIGGSLPTLFIRIIMSISLTLVLIFFSAIFAGTTVIRFLFDTSGFLSYATMLVWTFVALVDDWLD